MEQIALKGCGNAGRVHPQWHLGDVSRSDGKKVLSESSPLLLPWHEGTQLAILDHNHNVGRDQAQTKEGTMKFKFVSRKGSRGWVARPQYEAKS